MEVKGVVVFEGSRGRRDSASAWGMEHVANRPIAHHVLDALESAGISEVIVVVPAPMGDPVRGCLKAHPGRRGLSIQYVVHRGEPDLADALSVSASAVGEAACVVHLASGLLGEPLRPFVERVQRETPAMLLIVHQDPAGKAPLRPATQQLLHIADLDPTRSTLSVSGVCAFAPGALSRAAGMTSSEWAEPELAGLAERIAASEDAVDVRPASSWRSYAGDPLDLLELNRLALDRLDPGVQRPANNGNRIEGRVSIHQEASVRSSVIVGPAVVGPGARIADAYIGPYTAIGAGAHIEGAEIERSIISAGASVTHVGGRLVASVVGRNARVFRDFSLPRALRLRVGDGTEVALC